MMDRRDMIEALRWQVEAGAAEAIGEAPVDRFAESAANPTAAAPPASAARPASSAPQTTPATPSPSPASTPSLAPAPPRPTQATARAPSSIALAGTAHELAAAANTVEELHQALERFDGCALKATATNLVFCDGNPQARVLMIGEAPGAEEDRQGKPFVGPAGKLLDRMLESIGLDRGSVLISNTIYWRPPGNRNPAPEEVAACLPFVERLVEIVDPAVLVLVGGIASKSLLASKDGIMKMHGRWFTFETPRMSRPVPTMPIYHPAFLLRSPGQKRATWRDLLEIRRRLDETA
jgi:DNA polymerase